MPERGPARGPLYFGVLVFIALCFVVGSDVFQGKLADTDVYSYANRVVDLRADGDWFDDTVDRIGPPEGHKQHWSRPFDTVLLAGAVVLEPFVGFDDALVLWATVVPVLAGVGTLLLLWRGFRDILPDHGLVAMPILFATSGAVLGHFFAGRADHQVLIALLIAGLLVKATTVLRSTDPTRRDALIFGGLCGLAMWTGVESVLVVGSVFAGLTLAWAAAQLPSARWIRDSLAAWAVSSAVVLLLENGSAWNHRNYDELSVVVVVLAALLTAMFSALDLLDRSDRLRTALIRMLALVVAVAGAGAVLFTVFPDLRHGVGGIDPLYRETRLRFLAEGVRTVGGDATASIGRFAIALAPLPLALWALLCLARRPHTWRRALPWLPMIVAGIVFTYYGFTGIKFGGPASVVLTPAAAAGFAAVADRLPRRALTPLLAIAALWWVPVALAFSESENTVVRDWCDTTAVAEVLGDPAGLGANEGLLLANADVGPELLFRTPHSVFSIPNHRTQPGYATAYAVMTGSATDARARFDATGADYVLTCTLFPGEWATDDETAFVHSLAGGDTPDWLTEIPLPDEAGSFRLFAPGAG